MRLLNAIEGNLHSLRKLKVNNFSQRKSIRYVQEAVAIIFTFHVICVQLSFNYNLVHIQFRFNELF